MCLNEKFNHLLKKMLLFLSNFHNFLVHKMGKSRFLARTHMEYFHLGIFVIPKVYLIRKYGFQTPEFFNNFFYTELRLIQEQKNAGFSNSYKNRTKNNFKQFVRTVRTSRKTIQARIGLFCDLPT